MAERRHYDKRTKLSAVLAADMVGVMATEEQTGIPESTIRYWMERPEFAEYRAKAREELGDEIKLVAHLAWQRIAEALMAGTIEPRDALFAAEKATSLHLLVTGQATSRTEHRDVTDGIPDELRDALEQALGSTAAVEPVSLELRRNGARKNGHGALPALFVSGGDPN